MGLEGASFRKKGELLLSHIDNFRNWMVPYSLNGVIALLQRGLSYGKDSYEKNWCALQLAVLLSQERVGPNMINDILDKTIKNADGEIILKEKDKYLLEKIGKAS